MSWELTTRFILAVLATYRLAQLVAFEDGPLDSIASFRAFFYVYKGKRRTGRIWDNVQALLECPYCLGVWFAGLMTLLTSLSINMDVLTIIPFWLAVAGGQSILQALLGDEE